MDDKCFCKTFFNILFWVLFALSFYFCFFDYLKDFSSTKSLWIGLVAGCVAILYAFVKLKTILLFKKGDEDEKACTKGFLDRTFKYLKTQYLFLILPMAFGVLLLIFFNGENDVIHFGSKLASCFALGGIFTIVCDFVSALIFLKSRERQKEAIKNSDKNAFKIGFHGASFSNFFTFGLALLTLTVLYRIFKDTEIISGFALGAAVFGLFIQSGAKVLSKSLIVKENLGKKTDEIPKNEAPAGFCAINLSYFTASAIFITAAIATGSYSLQLVGAFLPLILCAMGAFCAILAAAVVKKGEGQSAKGALQRGAIFAITLFLIGSYFIIKYLLNDFFGVFWAGFTGVLTSVLITLLTQFFAKKFAQPVSTCDENGSKYYFKGLFAAMSTTVLSVILAIIGALAAFYLAGGFISYTLGVYGISIAAIAQLAAGLTVNIISKYCEISKEINEKEEESFKKTMTLSTKAYKTSLFAFGATSTICAFIQFANIQKAELTNPFVAASLLLGAVLPFLYFAITVYSTAVSIDKKEEKETVKSANISTLLGSLIVAFIFTFVIFSTKCLLDTETSKMCLLALLAGALALGICIMNLLENVNYIRQKYAFGVALGAFIKLLTIAALVFAPFFI